MNNTRSAGRIAQNIVRLPIRAARSMARRFDPNYDLERQAKALPGRIGAQRLAQLQSIPGRCSERECRLVAHLATMAPSGGEIVEIGAFKGRVTGWLVEAAQMRPDHPAVASGPNLTFRFASGFPAGLACASLRHARANKYPIERRRPQQA
jgi:hypothetical protein